MAGLALRTLTTSPKVIYTQHRQGQVKGMLRGGVEGSLEGG